MVACYLFVTSGVEKRLSNGDVYSGIEIGMHAFEFVFNSCTPSAPSPRSRGTTVFKIQYNTCTGALHGV